jgi:hypothetical protein
VPISRPFEHVVLYELRETLLGVVLKLLERVWVELGMVFYFLVSEEGVETPGANSPKLTVRVLICREALEQT